MSDELPMYGDLMVQYEECQSQVAHLRQENAELKAEVVEAKWLLKHAGDPTWSLNYEQSKDWLRRREKFINPQPTQDPATAISRLYPSSERPVNPKP